MVINRKGKLRLIILFTLALVLSLQSSLSARTFISGVQMKGSDVTEPNPKRSKFMKTFSGGFGIANNQAFYQLLIEIIEPFDRKMYVKVEFYDPIDKKNPVIYESEIPIKHKTLTLTHGPVEGLKIYKNYWVKVNLFEIDNKSEPIDVLKQRVRSYVDTTTLEIGFYKGLEFKQ